MWSTLCINFAIKSVLSSKCHIKNATHIIEWKDFKNQIKYIIRRGVWPLFRMRVRLLLPLPPHLKRSNILRHLEEKPFCWPLIGTKAQRVDKRSSGDSPREANCALASHTLTTESSCQLAGFLPRLHLETACRVYKQNGKDKSCSLKSNLFEYS